jgi:acyl carrier protein
MNKTLDELNKIFIDVVDEDDIVLNESTTAQDVEDWDSLNHIQFVVAIEKYFDIKFTSAEIASWQNVGAMVSAVEHKLS